MRYIVTPIISAMIALSAVANAQSSSEILKEKTYGFVTPTKIALIKLLNIDEDLRTSAGITEEQMTSLEAIFTDFATNRKALVADLKDAKVVLEGLMAEEVRNEDEIMAAVSDIGNIKIDIWQQNVGAVLDIDEVLSETDVENINAAIRDKAQQARERSRLDRTRLDRKYKKYWKREKRAARINSRFWRGVKS